MTQYFRSKKIFDVEKIMKFVGKPCRVYKVLDPVAKTKELIRYGIICYVDETYIKYVFADTNSSDHKGYLYATETLFDEISDEQWEDLGKTLYIIEIME